MVCENCGKEHDGSYASGRFCCKECARSFSTKNYKSGVKLVKCIDCGKEIYINKRYTPAKARCEECNKYYQYNVLHNKNYVCINNTISKNRDVNCSVFNIKCEDCYFKKNDLCKGKTSIISMLKLFKKYCNLEIGTYDEVLNQYFFLKDSFQNMINDGYSPDDICKNVFHTEIKGGKTILKYLQVKTKSLSEAVINAYLNGKMNQNTVNQYKASWHTTWDNKEVFLRSSYESDYANKLDEQKVLYEVEHLHIKYFDSQRNDYYCATPDFYLPETNTIVEIKSTWTLDIQQMKDKVKAYKDLGYNFKLVLNHEEVDLDKL